MCQCVPQYTLLSTHNKYLYMFIALNHWSGFRPLASTTPLILGSHQDFSRIPYCRPVPWRSCRFGSAGLAPLCAPAVHRWVESRWANSKPWIWASSGGQGRPLLSGHSSPPSRLQFHFSTVLKPLNFSSLHLSTTHLHIVVAPTSGWPHGRQTSKCPPSLCLLKIMA